jgi:hypothetical protein
MISISIWASVAFLFVSAKRELCETLPIVIGKNSIQLCAPFYETGIGISFQISPHHGGHALRLLNSR